MKVQTIWTSDRKAGKLRCQTCEQLYASSYYATLLQKGCACGQQFENASLSLEIRAKIEFRRILAILRSRELDAALTDDDDDT